MSTILIIEKTYGCARHDGRDGVLVDKLGNAIATQQQTEIIKPGDDALQFHAVNKKDGDWSFRFPDVIEEGVLQILGLFLCHGMPSLSLLYSCRAAET
jgi:hypothetical protein